MLPRLFSEDFETSSKRSVKIPSLTIGPMQRSLSPLKNIHARGYVESVISEFHDEIQCAFDYLGEKKTVSGFLEDMLLSLEARETSIESTRNLVRISTQAPLVPPIGQADPSTSLTSGTPYGVVGERVDLPILNYAPLNEMGVIVLFGYYLQDLGFSHLEEIRAGFPDAIAMRPIGNGKFQRVRIEFEFRSSSFKVHGHAIDGCEVIVCWIHDWADCPLEVIELKTALFED